MLGTRSPQTTLLLLPATLEAMIPDDHVLKRVHAVLDLQWLTAAVADCYDPTGGRPSLPPETALRLMLAGLLLGIVHDRALLREAQVNLAIRWFCALPFEQPLPDHSTLTVIRQRWGADRFRAIFQRIVDQCVAAGLVAGEVLHVDATLVRADVSWQSLVTERVDAVLAAHPAPDPPLPPPAPKAKKRSRTDPDASLATSSKSYHLEPSYKVHTAVDDQSGVLVDVLVTTGEAAEGQVLLTQLDHVAQQTGALPQTVTADGSYALADNYARCELLGIDAVIPPQREPRRPKRYPLRCFRYDAVHQRVRCPARQVLSPVPGRPGVFRGTPARCQACPRRAHCLLPREKVREVTIPLHYAALLRARRRHERGWDAATRRAYRRHRWRAEGAHAEAKTRHGLRRMVRRGIEQVAIQVYLTGAVLNLKRLARQHILAPVTAAWRRLAVLLAPFRLGRSDIVSIGVVRARNLLASRIFAWDC